MASSSLQGPGLGTALGDCCAKQLGTPLKRGQKWMHLEGSPGHHQKEPWQPPLHFRLCGQLRVYTPQNHGATALHCQLPAAPPWRRWQEMLHRNADRTTVQATTTWQSQQDFQLLVMPLTSRLPSSRCGWVFASPCHEWRSERKRKKALTFSWKSLSTETSSSSD